MLQNHGQFKNQTANYKQAIDEVLKIKACRDDLVGTFEIEKCSGFGYREQHRYYEELYSNMYRDVLDL